MVQTQKKHTDYGEITIDNSFGDRIPYFLIENGLEKMADNYFVGEKVSVFIDVEERTPVGFVESFQRFIGREFCHTYVWIKSEDDRSGAMLYRNLQSLLKENGIEHYVARSLRFNA